MNVRVIESNSLSVIENEHLNKLSLSGTISQQLWFIELLTENKVKIYVYGEYETILFVPYRSKFGVKYAYMPVFIQKLSFLGSKTGINPIVKELINTIRFGEISLSIGPGEMLFDSYKIRKNHTLDLDKPYDDISSEYSGHHKRNCKKASNLSVSEGNDLSELISLYQSEKRKTLGEKKLNDFITNLLKLQECERIKNSSIIFNAFDENQLVASIFLLKFNGVLYYILGSSIKSDKTVSPYGLFKLFDHIIHMFSNQGLKLDFEGSDILGIARFFKGFGATESEFQFVRWNALPFPLKILKK